MTLEPLLSENLEKSACEKGVRCRYLVVVGALVYLRGKIAIRADLVPFWAFSVLWDLATVKMWRFELVDVDLVRLCLVRSKRLDRNEANASSTPWTTCPNKLAPLWGCACTHILPLVLVDIS